MDVLVGVRVVRGPNWTWGEQDGGEGHVGTVAEVLKSDRSAGAVDQGCSGPCIVTVQWDCGNRCRYRCGVGDRYDLRVLDSAPAGIKHHRVMCNICGLQLTGMRWKCVKCYDYDLCTFCYMTGEHELDHAFDRMDTPRLRVRVPTRVISKKKEARGIYQNAKVVPGRDWVAPAGGRAGLEMFICGEVVSVLGINGDNSRGYAEVKWDDSDYSSIHRVGFEGKVELKCIEPSCVSYYYPDHLPDLGEPTDESEIVQSHDISPGDYVTVELDPEVFRAMHESNEETGWDDLMMQVVGTSGQVQSVFDSGNLRIRFSRLHVWTICAEAVVKADFPRYSVGDTVSVTTDEDKLAIMISKQKDFGEYYSMFYGEVCRVYEVSPGGIVTITSKQKLWTFIPSFLVIHNDLASLPWSNPLPNADSLDILRHYLTKHPDQVNRKLSGRTALHCAAVTGNHQLIKLLLEFGVSIEIEDTKHYRALHYSVMSGSTAAAEVLISAGADVNSKGYNGNTPLILAANGGHAGIAKLLLKHPHIRIHEVDLDGNTALHVAVITQHLQIVTMLLDSGADPSMVNFRLGNPFIEAARIGLTAAVERMIEQNPDNAKITNEYQYNLLHTGALYGRQDIVSLAIEKAKIDVDSREEIGQTALHVAIQESHIPVIEQLIKYGADVNATDDHRLTPLHTIIICRDFFDIPSDASPEIKKFHEALMGKLPDNVNKLYSPVSLLVYFLKKGADIHIVNRNGQSPLAMLPYLANLMTTLVENEDLLSENSTFTSKEGIFAMSGAERPYMYSTKAELKRESVLLQRHRPGGTRRAGNDTTIPYTASDYGEDRESTALASRDTSTFGPSFSYHQMGNQASSSPRSHPTSSYSERSSNTPHSRAAAGSYGMSYSSSQQQRRQHYSPVGYSHRYENQTTQSSQRREQGTLQSNSTCFLCDSPANVTFHPCGHSVMCSQCAKRAKKCPTCRGQVQDYSRI